jgi:predicted dehydrogenase
MLQRRNFNPPRFTPLVSQFQDFIDALRERRVTAVSGLDARNAVAIIRGICSSAESGLPV